MANEQISEITTVPTNATVIKIINALIKRYNSLGSNLTTYTSLEQLGITPGQESFASIHSALPINSALEYYAYVNGNFNDEFYPVSNYYGVLQAVKLNDTKTVFSFYAHTVISGNEFSELYLSAYHSSVADTTVWKKVALDSDLTNLSNSVVKSVNGIKPTNGNVLLPLIKNITTNQGVITFTKNDDITTQVDNIKKLYVSTLGENINLNDLTESGIYICASNAYAANYENCPIQKAFLLEVQAANSGDFVYQFLTQYNDGSTEAGNQYVRTYQATNGWSAWRMAGISNNINRKSYNNLASLGLSHQTVTFADIINTLPVNSTLTFYVDVVTSEPSYAPNLQIPASGLVIVVKGASNTIPTLFYLTPIVKGYTSYTGQYTTYNDYGFSGWQPMVLSVNAIKPNINGNVTIDIPKPVIASEAEAKAGTNNTKFMTPLRVAQAIEAQDGNPIVSASVAGRVITFTKKDGSISTITTQDTTTTNIASITPNYDAGVSVGTSFTAPNIGWILGYFNISGETGSYAYVNGKVIANEWGDIASVQILVNQGDVFYTTGTSLNLTFYPCKGA